MEQSDPVQAKMRELVSGQLGYQLFTLCELNARVDVLTGQLAAVTKERDELKAKKARAERV